MSTACLIFLYSSVNILKFSLELLLLIDLEFSFPTQVVALSIFNEKIECRNNHMYIVTCVTHYLYDNILIIKYLSDIARIPIKKSKLLKV